ncbi:TPA: DUF1642 domain-containing protein [Listeria monocytogenes]|uniref:DUF1642 domain-containing protein n=1 Tax=Listeria monocytogenes TaxID=1639 RepID=UPI000F100615|nr:DUF1642 domain-containing protein [Listeria monocytogenes]EAC2981467.1 DUF1642 domain-containing protein [Listeria monocytogenes]EHE3091273.1 DUF1642 domain-containing protein [Listeria monocytogenes]EHE4711312.1 DUF1642 domain-containing protein [Listeria monocytogenes]EJI4217150.1 DUF1642 domain-containing protein [Listeria monocytogenes]EKO5977187.1 DUF1642 domain-containing protein [Listeria monocytogenes]
MKFKEGDKAEFIYRNKKSIGVINGVYPGTREVSIKQSDSPIDLLFSDKAVVKVEEQERIVVPQFVADWISRHKQEGYNLIWSISYENNDMPDEIYEWLTSAADNQELFARAWLDGYEVEKEPLYYVRLPLSTWNDDAAELEVINMYVLLNVQSDETSITGSIINENKEWRTKLTEAEIKGIPGGEIYWQFAVLVEEAEA